MPHLSLIQQPAPEASRLVPGDARSSGENFETARPARHTHTTRAAMDAKPPVNDAPTPVAPTPPAPAPPAPAAAAAGSTSSSSSASRFAPPKAVPKENPFVYLGIPQAVFDYRPKVPGPKMSVFLALTIGSTVAYIYDRRECKRLKEHYIDEVKWMSEEKLDTTEQARKVRILAARIPEDSTVDRSTIFFKRYIRGRGSASSTHGCADVRV
jgi:hypothetical protein